MVDPLTGYDDEQDRVDREDERIREERWTAFVQEIRPWHDYGHNWYIVMVALTNSLRHPRSEYGPGRLEWHMHQFMETEGWDGVLTAIARAYREEQQKERQ